MIMRVHGNERTEATKFNFADLLASAYDRPSAVQRHIILMASPGGAKVGKFTYIYMW